MASGQNKVGDGVLTQEVAQQFTQGSLQFTNNSLDLAITGNGFFGTVPDITSRDFSFTRAGQFKIDSDNFVVNSSGDNLLGFPVNPVKAQGKVNGEEQTLVTAINRHVDSVSLAGSSQGIILNLDGDVSVKLDEVLQIGG